MTAIRRWLHSSAIIPVVALLGMIGGCNSGGSNGGETALPGAAGTTGSVAVLFTDGPTDDFDEINITITRIELIGEGGERAEVFAGERTVNLLDLRNNSDVFSLVDVRVGTYDKIRMTVTALELVRRDAQGNVVEVIEPELPANGRIDLNPRTEFLVSADDTLILEIDMDAEKSFHVVERGNGGYNFRPVVFVKIVSGAVTGKFTKLSGTIDLDGTDPETYRLCRTRVAFDRDGDGDGDLDHLGNLREDDDSDDDYVDDDLRGGNFDDEGRGCLMLDLADDISVFNAEGATTVADIMDGDVATVIGRLQRTANGVVLHALVVELGLASTFVDVVGTVASSYDESTGTFEVDVGRSGDFEEGTRIAVELLEGAKVLSHSGLILAAADITVGRKVKIEGLLTGESPELRGSVVFLRSTIAADQKYTGTVRLEGGAGWDFMLLGTAAGDVCVRLEEDGDVFEVSTDGGTLVSDLIGLAGLRDDQQADVYGHFHFGCLEADDVVVAAPPQVQ